MEGAVQRPGEYQIVRGMTLKDILYQSGGLQEAANIETVELYKVIDIEEKGFYNTKYPDRELVRISLDTENWQESAIADSIEVVDYYKIIVRSKGEFYQPGTISVKGLVNSPGTFPVTPNMTLKDVMYLARGPKIDADLQNIELSRVIEVLDDGTGEIIPYPYCDKKYCDTAGLAYGPYLGRD